MTLVLPPTPELIPLELQKNPRAGLRIITAEQANVAKAKGIFGYSPSQIDTFRDCVRKWGFGSIEYAPRPENAAANLGTECHTHWENYLRHGTAPPNTLAGKVARATLRYLPLPGVAVIEGETKLFTPLGIFTTRIDFSVADQGAHSLAALGDPHPTWDQSLPLAGVPLTGDHKSTSNIDDYAKRPEDLIGDGTSELPGDAQATGYSLIQHAKHPEATAFDLFWSYSQTKGAKRAHPVRARHSLTTLDRSLSYFWPDVAQMRFYKENTKRANDLPANPLSCDKYGGCPYRDRCALTNEQRNDAMMSETGSLATLLGIGGPATASAPPPPPATTSAPAPVSALLGGLLGAAPLVTPPPAATSGLLGAAPTAPTPPVENIDPTALETCRGLAAKLFSAGRVPPEGANPLVISEYAKILELSKVNPPDAAPSSGPLLGVPMPAPASSPVPPVDSTIVPPAQAAEIAKIVEQTEKAAKKTKAKEPAPVTGSAIELLEAALSVAARDRQFALVSKIADVLAAA